MRKMAILTVALMIVIVGFFSGCETVNKDSGGTEEILDLYPEWVQPVIQVEVYSEYLYYGDKTYNAGAKVRIQVYKEEHIELDWETATNSIGEAGAVAPAFLLTPWENVTVTVSLVDKPEITATEKVTFNEIAYERKFYGTEWDEVSRVKMDDPDRLIYHKVKINLPVWTEKP